MPQHDSLRASTCQPLRAGDTYAGKQGFPYFRGISAERAGSQGICMHLPTIPPGQRANVHLHEDHETAIYALSGRGRTWYGDQLEQATECRAGEIISIPAGVPHLPSNPYEETCVAVVARADPNEQESVVLRPNLDDLVPAED